MNLEELKTATRQEVFDVIVNHLLTQNEKSMGPSEKDPSNEVCKYFGPRGLKCAAGCLIDDYEYRSDLENSNWSGLVSSGKVPYAHQDTITALQCIHDSDSVKNWERCLRQYAEKNLVKFNWKG